MRWTRRGLLLHSVCGMRPPAHQVCCSRRIDRHDDGQQRAAGQRRRRAAPQLPLLHHRFHPAKRSISLWVRLGTVPAVMVPAAVAAKGYAMHLLYSGHPATASQEKQMWVNHLQH